MQSWCRLMRQLTRCPILAYARHTRASRESIIFTMRLLLFFALATATSRVSQNVTLGEYSLHTMAQKSVIDLDAFYHLCDQCAVLSLSILIIARL